MKRVLCLMVICGLAGVFVAEAFGCEGCYHESYDYVKTIKDLEEPSKSIALALWFGAYSSDTLKDPKIWDVGNGRVMSMPGETNVEPDKKYVGYVNFWNSHIAHVTNRNKNRNILSHHPNDMMVTSIPLPGKGGKVILLAAIESKDRERTSINFSISNLSVRSQVDGKAAAAKLGVKLYLADIKQYGGRMQCGWGLTGKARPKVVLNKTIELNAKSGYDLKLKELFNNETGEQKKHEYFGIIAEFTTLEGPAQKSQLVLRDSQDWNTAAAKVFKRWEVVESGRYEKADIQKAKASRLLLRKTRHEYIGQPQQIKKSKMGEFDSGNYQTVFSFIEIITFDENAELGNRPVNKLSWNEWEDIEGHFVKSVDLGTGYGRRWFVRTTLSNQDKLRTELNLIGGDDPVKLLVDGLLVKDEGDHTANSVVHLIPAYGDEGLEHIAKAVSAHDSAEILDRIILPLANMYSEAANELVSALYNDPKTQKAAGYALASGRPRKGAKSIYMDMLKKRRHIRLTGLACVRFKWVEAVEILRQIYETPKNWGELSDSFKTLRMLEQKPVGEELSKAEHNIYNYAAKPGNEDKVKKAVKTIAESKDKQAAAFIAASMARAEFKAPPEKKQTVNRIGRELLKGLGEEGEKMIKKTEAFGNN